ncbi:hypothetical protein AMECASPLE_032495 [Ameca splendens]|uniref:Uncharacterized protein n=1 Tax=Ameca splendens TaxID=208324 RepID=A0ABV0XVW4_9TELE
MFGFVCFLDPFRSGPADVLWIIVLLHNPTVVGFKDFAVKNKLHVPMYNDKLFRSCRNKATPDQHTNTTMSVCTYDVLYLNICNPFTLINVNFSLVFLIYFLD